MTHLCEVCGTMIYENDKCPRCYGAFVDGKLPFKEIPPELEEFYEEGLRISGWDYEKDWKPCEKIRRELYAKLHSAEAQRGSAEDQRAFRERAIREAKAERQRIIDAALPRIRSAHELFNSDLYQNDERLENFQF